MCGPAHYWPPACTHVLSNRYKQFIQHERNAARLRPLAFVRKPQAGFDLVCGRKTGLRKLKA